MLKLLSRSKHEEFESNSALQIKNEKERRAENARKLEPAGNLAGYKIFATCENNHLLPLFTVASTVHPFLRFCPFLLFCHFFVCFPNYLLCSSDSSCNLVILLVLVAI